jgi:uncharacterized protein YcgL (UPF0745 family)
MKVVVYKTPGQKDLFLYVAEEDGLSRVPDPLLEKFKTPEVALTFDLHDERFLAREDPKRVLQNIKKEGFHLQMPPAENEW